MVLGFSYWVIKYLFISGYFPMHDDTQVARVVVMGRALRQGQFPVRWVSDLGYGYGYPIYNFYGPLPYYVGGSLYAAGVDSVVATKAMFGIGALIGAVFLYLSLEPIIGMLAAVTGSLLFLYAPYHAVDIYVRGAVDEYWAIAFLPVLLWGILRVCENKRQTTGIVIGSLGLFGVIVSHTILGFLTTILFAAGTLIYGIIEYIQKRSISRSTIFLCLILVLGLGLSAFFWLPAFGELRVTGVAAMVKNAPTNFFDHFVCINQLWDSPWGYGGSAPGCIDGMSFKLGKLQLILSIAGIVAFIVSVIRKKLTKTTGLMIIASLLFLVSVVGTIDVSKPIWSLVPFVSFIQYPWRLLSFTILAMGVCGGYFISTLPNRNTRIVVALIVIAVCIFMNSKLFKPQYIYFSASKNYETSQELRFNISKISDEYLPPAIIKPTIVNDIVIQPIDNSKTLQVNFLKNSDTYLKAQVVSSSQQQVVLKKAYFPGWQYLVNGKIIVPTIVHGLPSVVVFKGISIIEAKFTDTPIRVWGNFIAVATFILLGGIVYYGKKTNS